MPNTAVVFLLLLSRHPGNCLVPETAAVDTGVFPRPLAGNGEYDRVREILARVPGGHF